MKLLIENWRKFVKENDKQTLSEKRFANDPKLDKDGDGIPKWADKDDNDSKVGAKEEEEESLEEKKMTKSQMKKREKMVKGMKGAAKDFEKRYPGRGKSVMYATATKMAQKKKKKG